MKRKAKLEARTLDAEALQQVQGARGSYCGNQVHCDCGYSWVYTASNVGTCPSCGAATGLSSSSSAPAGGGGGGGGGGCCTKARVCCA